MPAQSASPPSLTAVASRVDERLGTLFERELHRWQSLEDDLAEPLLALRRLVESGGKRLRPAFCYWGYIGAGGEADDSRVIDAGAAFEVFHAFALVHDDVMDGSETRRGMATAHVTFGDLHRNGTWRGEPRRFGEGAAILIGDVAHVYADQLLNGVVNNRDVAEIWHEMRLEVNVGQYLDLLGTARADRDPGYARRIARYKSGKYTIERPLHVGAALAGRLGDLQEQLSDYGDPLGEAFQLRDDVLGAFGDEALTGKPVGQDLREGKPTPLLATASREATAAQTQVLDHAGSANLSGDQIAEIQQVLLDTGALDEVEGLISELTTQAIEAVKHADITPEARDALVELADYVAYRDS